MRNPFTTLKQSLGNLFSPESSGEQQQNVATSTQAGPSLGSVLSTKVRQFFTNVKQKATENIVNKVAAIDVAGLASSTVNKIGSAITAIPKKLSQMSTIKKILLPLAIVFTVLAAAALITALVQPTLLTVLAASITGMLTLAADSLFGVSLFKKSPDSANASVDQPETAAAVGPEAGVGTQAGVMPEVEATAEPVVQPDAGQQAMPAHRLPNKKRG